MVGLGQLVRRPRSNSTLWLLVFGLLGVALRVGLIVATRGSFRPNNDPADYDRIARSLAAGHGFGPTLLAAPDSPSALRPPGYPAVLAVLYKLGGSWTAGRLLGALLGMLVVGLVYVIARALWGERPAVVAAAVACISPPLIALNGSLLSEPLFLVFELLVVVSVIAYQRGRRPLLIALIVGVLCGLAALTRSAGLFLPLAAAWGILAAPRRELRPRLWAVLVMLLATAATIAPWTIRNASQFHGAFVPVSTQDGITAAGTYNAQAAAPGPDHGVWRPPYLVPAFQHLFDDRINEAQMDVTLRDSSLSYALDHPGYVLAVTGLDSLRLLYVGPASGLVSRNWYYEMGIPRHLRPWISVLGDLVIAVALVGVIIAVMRSRDPARDAARAGRRQTAFLWSVPALMYLSAAPIQGGFRYRAPLDPFFVLLAGYALTSVKLRPTRKTRHQT